MPSLTRITDLTPQEIQWILKEAFEYKNKKDCGVPVENILRGKVVALVFEKPSLRTRVAFEAAAALLGGIPIFLSEANIFTGNNKKPRESVSDIIKNLERFADVIVARVHDHATILKMASSSKKPIINALSDLHHPTQALADLMAIRWHKKNQKHPKVAFVGDGNNVAVSLMHICAMMGLHFAIASPQGYEIPGNEKRVGREWAKKGKTSVEFLRNPKEAVENADVVYTDTFVSMGQESKTRRRLKDFQGYKVDQMLLRHAKSDAIVMHCLPAHRGQEITSDVLDGPQSIIFDQAECRLHIAKALLTFYLIH